MLLFCGLKAAAQRNYFNEFTQLLEQEDTIAAKKLLTDWKKMEQKMGTIMRHWQIIIGKKVIHLCFL
ncbi:hypothetical protein HMPREF9296_1450 [Prevotella disiens FB035-09AN]|uniref:Uncharacterized protein n=1 Tax=Prevotella disiens FB035-09AN TaxID=866771 RepID=E1KRZ0_9BACT|nr:hypothetical protein HMPREF9296_1450 [Prevotella disiens FB035-09AN]